MHAWKPGETITAARLRSGYASGQTTIPFESTTGRTTVDASGSLYDGPYYRQTVDVAFPAGAFTAPPVVTATAGGGVPGTVMELTITNVSTTGFTLVGARQTATNTNVWWIAIDTSN